MTTDTKDVKIEFDRLLESIRRKNYKGQCFYHPVDDVKSWMVTSRGANGPSNAAYLLDLVSHPRKFLKTSPEAIRNALIVFAILLRIDCGHLVHIFQHYVLDDFLNAPIPTDRLMSDLHESRLKYPSDVLDRFDEERWAFCAANMQDMYYETKIFEGGRWIMPFCKQEEVKREHGAVVFRALVQKDLVSNKVQELMEGTCEFFDEDFGSCFQFAIKSYPADAYKLYQDEVKNYRAIGKTMPGVLKYFGAYEHQGFPSGQTGLQTAFNIVLEFADH
ncbi:hypothetical protein QBC43DRAFT_286785 [Cladorrhinum sp. PSN259]|nr:hypothetical protein QBC43DRAFT_286785 [Cladorrhinum sp. PSN259]